MGCCNNGSGWGGCGCLWIIILIIILCCCCGGGGGAGGGGGSNSGGDNNCGCGNRQAEQKNEGRGACAPGPLSRERRNDKVGTQPPS